MNNRNVRKILLLLLIVGAIAAFYGLEGQHYLAPGVLKALYRDNPWWAACLFFMAYVGATGLSLPGAAIFTLIGGFIFGFWPALLLISFASTIGATLAFLCARTLLKDWVQRTFAKPLQTINAGVDKDGAFYLFTLRLIPAVPFFVINLAMGLTPIKTRTFYWVSQLGMLPGTAVYVNAGAQVGQIETLSVSNVLTPSLIGAFLLLGIFPWLARQTLAYWQKQA